MATVNSERLVHYLRHLVNGPAAGVPDAELLRRYVADNDQSAFASLVRRHGAMVYGVCRSVLRQRQDAEDAFQAAFLVLARKAAAIRRPEGLAGWLHKVAFRVALRARAAGVRRQACEAKAACAREHTSCCDELSWGDLVFASALTNPYFIREVNRTRSTLYAA